MGQNLIQAQGGQAQKPTHFVPLFTSRFLTGYWPNRNLLRSPMQYIYSDFYHLGSTDAMSDGLNTELSVNQTVIRRPGNPLYCTVETDAAVDAFYSFHESTGTITPLVDTVDKVDILGVSSLTTIFNKNSAAEQSFFAGVNLSCYITDSVDTVKYIPNLSDTQVGNKNPQLPSTPFIWNINAPAPTAPPQLTVVEGGATGVNWVASTMWTTMGLLLDSNGNVQQMVSVNLNGTNSTQIGTTGNGAPAFSLTPGGTVTESSGTPITWTNWGAIVAWSASGTWRNYSYAPSGGAINASCVIYDPTTNSCYGQINGGAGATVVGGLTRPPFTPTAGWTYNDGHAKWAWLGAPNGLPGLWQPSTSYPAWGGGDDTLRAVVTPCTIPTAAIGTANATTVYLQASSGGTSAAAGSYTPQWSTSVGATTNESSGGDIIWNCLGTATWAATTSYNPWSSGSNNFSVVSATVSGHAYFFVCIAATGPSGSSTPSWNVGSGISTAYGATTQDGTNVGTPSFVGVTWACVGYTSSWAANTQWYLPISGFVPPNPGQNYGGATLVDSGGYNQYVINSGLSGSSAPSWNETKGNTTTDNNATWYNNGKFTSAVFAWTAGFGYCYALKARTVNDVFVSQQYPPLQTPNTNSPNITGYLGQPTGCGDGTVTTASPVAQITGANTGGQIIITIPIPAGGFDPQFDTIELYRSADGFGASGPYLFLTDIPIPPVGTPTAQIIDFMPDLPTALLVGLNPLIEAPIDHANDPAPGEYGSTQFVASATLSTVPQAGTAITGLVYHQGRLWGFVGNSVFCSGGPDTNPGNGMTAWPPTNEFPFDDPIVLLYPTSSALLVFTTNDILLIGGGPAITEYYSQLLVPNVGILSPNAVCLVLGLPYLFSSDREFITVDPSGGFTRVGHPIGNKLVSFNPANVYVTHHVYGDQDHAIYISDGASQWYRCDPYPAPDSQVTGPTWSPVAQPVGGVKALQSIVVSAGQRKLLLGPTAAGYILARDSSFTTFTDNGSAYESYYTMGNIVLAHPGQMAQCAFLEFDFVKTGTSPTVSVLFDELGPYNGASFEVVSNYVVSDPPKLYGQTATPDTMWMNRYYFGQTTPTAEGGEADQTPSPAWCKFLQIKVDYGSTDEVQNETLAFTIFGALFQEK